MTWRALPKVELHLHLEGAAPPEFIRGLAKEKRVDLSKIFAQDGSYAYRDFVHFLSVYEAATSVLKSPEDFKRLTLAVLEESASEGVVYSETFLSPDFCGGRDLVAWREYLAAMAEAADEADAKFGITLKGIVTCIRHFGPDKARETARCAAETKGDFLRGFGMAGDENVGKPGDFTWAFDCAREAGLRLTSHACEWRGPDEVTQTLDALKVERIGHGVRAHSDATVMARVIDEGVVLEVCPLSNVVLGVFADMASHPIERMRSQGVKVTVSTDDPPFFHTTMSKEYAALEQAFGWDEAVFAEINSTALEAAFCDAATKEKIAARLANGR